MNCKERPAKVSKDRIFTEHRVGDEYEVLDFFSSLGHQFKTKADNIYLKSTNTIRLIIYNQGD